MLGCDRYWNFFFFKEVGFPDDRTKDNATHGHCEQLLTVPSARPVLVLQVNLLTATQVPVSQVRGRQSQENVRCLRRVEKDGDGKEITGFDNQETTFVRKHPQPHGGRDKTSEA